MTIALDLQPETEARLRLIAKAQGLLLDDYLQMLVEEAAQAADGLEKPHSVLELEGVGAELWKGRDAQEYVNELRDEWDACP